MANRHWHDASDSLAAAALWLATSAAALFGCSGVENSGNDCSAANAIACATGGHTSVTSIGGSSNSTGTSSAGNGAGGSSGNAGDSSSGGAVPTGGHSAAGGTGAGGAVTGGTSSTSSSATCAGTHTNPLSQSLIDQFVTAHNNARSGPLNPTPNPPLPPVTWDCILADAAYNYLSKCPGGNVSLAPHNANRSTDYQALGGSGYVGENIYASTGSSVAPQDAVNSWMSEASAYNYNTNNITAAGHYTQVVWRASVRIGCAIVNCSNYTYHNTILCDYAPGGNITNQKPY